MGGFRLAPDAVLVRIHRDFHPVPQLELVRDRPDAGLAVEPLWNGLCGISWLVGPSATASILDAAFIDNNGVPMNMSMHPPQDQPRDSSSARCPRPFIPRARWSVPDTYVHPGYSKVMQRLGILRHRSCGAYPGMDVLRFRVVR
jgi:hypothetical protein